MQQLQQLQQGDGTPPANLTLGCDTDAVFPRVYCTATTNVDLRTGEELSSYNRTNWEFYRHVVCSNTILQVLHLVGDRVDEEPKPPEDYFSRGQRRALLFLGHVQLDDNGQDGATAGSGVYVEQSNQVAGMVTVCGNVQGCLERVAWQQPRELATC